MPHRLPTELIDAIISRPELDRHTKANCCLLSRQHLEIARDNLYRQVEWACFAFERDYGEEEVEIEWQNEYSLTAMKLWATLKSEQHLAKRVKAVHFRADALYHESQLSGIRTTLEDAAETIVCLATKVQTLCFERGRTLLLWPVDHCLRRFKTLRPNVRVWEIEDVVEPQTADYLFASHSLRRLAFDRLPSSFVVRIIAPSFLSLELPCAPTSSAPNLRFLTMPFALLPELRLSLLPSLVGLTLASSSDIGLSNKWQEREQLSAFWKDYSASQSLSSFSFKLRVGDSVKKARDDLIYGVLRFKPPALRRITLEDHEHSVGFSHDTFELVWRMFRSGGGSTIPQLAVFACELKAAHWEPHTKDGESPELMLVRELCSIYHTELILLNPVFENDCDEV